MILVLKSCGCMLHNHLLQKSNSQISYLYTCNGYTCMHFLVKCFSCYDMSNSIVRNKLLIRYNYIPQIQQAFRKLSHLGSYLGSFHTDGIALKQAYMMPNFLGLHAQKQLPEFVAVNSVHRHKFWQLFLSMMKAYFSAIPSAWKEPRWEPR